MQSQEGREVRFSLPSRFFQTVSMSNTYDLTDSVSHLADDFIPSHLTTLQIAEGAAPRKHLVLLQRFIVWKTGVKC